MRRQFESYKVFSIVIYDVHRFLVVVDWRFEWISINKKVTKNENDSKFFYLPNFYIDHSVSSGAHPATLKKNLIPFSFLINTFLSSIL